MKKAFTIVELLMVLAILSILITIVFSSAKGALQSARAAHAEALCRSVQSGIEAYHAMKDQWPAPLDSLSVASNVKVYELRADEVRQIVKVLVDEARKGNPLIDVSGLYVSRNVGEGGSRGYGLDFASAVRGTNRSRKKMTTGEMYYGYPDPASGYFRRFVIRYNIPTDSISVLKQGEE